MLRVFLITLVLLIPATCLALPYWPSPPDGTIYRYQNPEEQELIVRYSQVGNLQHREYIYEDPDKNGGEYYEITDELVNLTEFYSTLPGEDSTIIHYNPSFSIARIGMHSGLQWFWEGTCEYGVARYGCYVSSGWVDSPYGSNDVFHIRYRLSYTACTLPYHNVYLHPDFGPIKMDGWILI